VLDAYNAIVGQETIEQLRELAEPLAGMRVIHVNSTRMGGGVAEILANLVPMMGELGLNASWEVINGAGDFLNVQSACIMHYRVNLFLLMIIIYKNTNVPTLKTPNACVPFLKKPTLFLFMTLNRRHYCIFAPIARASGYGGAILT